MASLRYLSALVPLALLSVMAQAGNRLKSTGN